LQRELFTEEWEGIYRLFGLQLCLNSVTQRPHKARAILLKHALIKALELGYALFMRERGEAPKLFAPLHYVAKPSLEEDATESGGKVRERDFAL
jgi:3-methyladenine DNA glycosylase Mpg